MLEFHVWETRQMRKQASTDAAWLSSARGVSCSIKLGNERNPHRMLNNSYETVPILSGRKARMTSSQHGSYTLGYKHPTMAKNNEQQVRKCKLISEISPQFRLGSEIRPHEVGIASNGQSAGGREYVLGSCTHCPSRQQSRQWLKAPLCGGDAKVGDEA